MVTKRNSLQVRNRLHAFLLASILLLTLLPVPFRANAAEEEDAPKIMVSLGDSYSAGEGIEPFYDQDLPLSEKVGSPDWLAHRSENSWPGMLRLPSVDGKMVENRDTYWFFVAASGAETIHINGKFNKDYDKKESGWGGDEYKGSKDLDAQIDVFKQFDKGEVDYVTMTMGGNDAGFAKVVMDAATNGFTFWNPNELSDRLTSTWDKFYKKDGIRDDLKKAYSDIAKAAGENAQIIIAGYPKLLDPEGSGFLFNKEDATAINDAVTKFNDEIEKLVKECSKTLNIHFVSVEEEFEEHGAYADEPYINKVYIGSKDQDIKRGEKASAYSIHPNYEGAKAYARCVQEKINELEGTAWITVNQNLKVSVLDFYKELDGNHKIIIDGKEKASIFDIWGKDYHKEITVRQAEATKLQLPRGNYTVTVTDGNSSFSVKIKARKDADQKTLIFETDFGYVPEKEEDYYPDWGYVPDRVTSEERDVVLVLDTSGSMSGEPMEETKQAAINFIDTVLEQDASIALVTYADGATMESDFTVDAQYLKSRISTLYAYGGTNMDDGLMMAETMLQASSARKKIIVLMGDGLPNYGRVGQELIDYSGTLKKDEILIYTLGFFEELGSEKADAQALMEGIASDGCHYEVADAQDLVFFFEDMADQISGQKYIYIRIACPVDVTVTHDGQTLSSAEADLNQRTDFGTLTFEASENAAAGEDDRVKILRLKEGEKYDVQIVGTGRGVMNYTIGFMDEDGKYSDMREFERIKITRNTVIDTIAETSRKTTLNVDEDGDGKYDIRYRAGENETAEEVKSFGWIYVTVAVIAVAAGAAVILRKKNTKKKEG